MGSGSGLGSGLVRSHVDLIRVRVRVRVRVRANLRPDHAGDGGVVEDADAMQEELVAREGAHLVRG